jgi:hypothetical protein
MDVAKAPSSNGQLLSLGAAVGVLIVAIGLCVLAKDLSGGVKALIVAAAALALIVNVVLIVKSPKGAPRP